MNKIDKIGFNRLMSNIVLSIIREFNENPSKYLMEYNTFFTKIVLKGRKAFNLLLKDYPDPENIEADIFVKRETLDEIVDINELNNLISQNAALLNHLGSKIKEVIDKKINFKKVIESGELSNMIYIIQLDAIFSLFKDVCKDSYLKPQLEEKLKCFNSFVTFEIDPKNQNNLQFYLQIQFRQTPFPIQVNWSQERQNKNIIKIPFFSIKIAEPFLQIEEYKKRLSLEISPYLYVYNPLLVINNISSLGPDEVQEYRQVIRKPFRHYKCSVIGKIPLYSERDMEKLDRMPHIQQLNKSHPLYKTQITESYRKYINNSSNKNLHQMEKELNDMGVNPSKQFRIFNNPLEKYKNNIDEITNRDELKNIKKRCKNKVINNRDTKYYTYSKAVNYYPFKYYGMYNQPIPISYSTIGQLAEDKMFFKFVSLSYLKLFVQNGIPVSLDEVEDNEQYFLNLPLDEMNSDEISRDFLNQDGFLILIKKFEMLKATPNVKKTDKGNFFNCGIKLVEKKKIYIKILIDGRDVYDYINVLVFEQVKT